MRMLRNISRISVLLLLASAPLFGKSITTDYDETIDIVIPDGMTAEEAFYDMAKMYREEKHDREEIQSEYDSLATAMEEERKSAEELIASKDEEIATRDTLIESLKEQVSQYEELSTTQDKEISALKGSKLKLGFYIDGGAGYKVGNLGAGIMLEYGRSLYLIGGGMSDDGGYISAGLGLYL